MKIDLSNMGARHLEVFLAMMTSQRQADAALKLNISEPAVSKSIRFLEREAGVQFFVRVGGRLRPTEHAERILPYVQRAVRSLNTARSVIYGLNDSEEMLCEIAAGGAALTHLVPEAVRRLMSHVSRARCLVRAEHTSDIVRLVADRQVDLGVATSPADSFDFRAIHLCETEVLSADEMVAVLPRDHPLAERSVVRPPDLVNESLVLLPEFSPTMQLLEATFHQFGTPMRSRVTASNSATVCQLVRKGLGIGLLNPWTLAGETFVDLTSRPFRPRVLLHTCVYLPKYARPSTGTSQLVTHLRQIVAKPDA